MAEHKSINNKEDSPTSPLSTNPKHPNNYKNSFPSLSNCHGCNSHFPSPPKSKTLNLKPLKSEWRITLLCNQCHHLINSRTKCSYCFCDFPIDTNQETFIDCNQCLFRIHVDCVPVNRRFISASFLDRNSFVCIDCCALPKSEDRKVRDLFVEAEKKRAEADRANEVAFEKAMAAKHAVEKAREALGDFCIGEIERDNELALKLHLDMNGAERVLRSMKSNRCLKNCEKVGFCKEDKGKRVKSCEKVGVCKEDKVFLYSYDVCEKLKKEIVGIRGNGCKDVNCIEDNSTLAGWITHQKEKKSKGLAPVKKSPAMKDSLHGLGNEGCSQDGHKKKYHKKKMSLKEVSSGGKE